MLGFVTQSITTYTNVVYMLFFLKEIYNTVLCLLILVPRRLIISYGICMGIQKFITKHESLYILKFMALANIIVSYISVDTS